jgi:hypothetical protein
MGTANTTARNDSTDSNDVSRASAGALGLQVHTQGWREIWRAKLGNLAPNSKLGLNVKRIRKNVLQDPHRFVLNFFISGVFCVA